MGEGRRWRWWRDEVHESGEVEMPLGEDIADARRGVVGIEVAALDCRLVHVFRVGSAGRVRTEESLQNG